MNLKIKYSIKTERDSSNGFGKEKNKRRNKKKIKKEQGNPLINHPASMADLLSLPHTPFEKTRGRKIDRKCA